MLTLILSLNMNYSPTHNLRHLSRLGRLLLTPSIHRIEPLPCPSSLGKSFARSQKQATGPLRLGSTHLCMQKQETIRVYKVPTWWTMSACACDDFTSLPAESLSSKILSLYVQRSVCGFCLRSVRLLLWWSPVAWWSHCSHSSCIF